MENTRVNSGAPDIHFFPVLHSTSLIRNRDAPFQGKFQVNLLKMTIITPHMQRKRGKVIDRGVHIII